MQKIRYTALTLFLFLLASNTAWSQLKLNMEEVVLISRTKSLSARKAFVQKKNAYWNYQIYKSHLRPQLSLDTDLADFSKGVTPVVQEDGSIAIKSVNHNSTNASLSLLQPIPFMGADIFISSSLYRFDNLSSKKHSYSSQPVEFGMRLPLFKFNELKWDKRIKPVAYLESKKEYDRNLEASSYRAVQMFFQNLSDRHEWNMAQANMELNTDLYRISKEKYKTGRISQDELLQIQLMMINATKSLKSAKVQMENSGLQLLTHLSLSEISDFIPMVPETIPTLKLSPEQAVSLAIENNPESVAFKRRLLEAQREVAIAKGQTGISGNAFASVGYGSNFDMLPDWNQDVNQHALLQVGLSIPIIDWGRSHAARKKASINQELVETSVMQERIDFEKEIISLVNVVEMLKENLEVVSLADTISAQRYEIAYKRYLAGDISILELNMAQKEKDYASRDRLYTLGEFWVNYHRLRMITLYDFMNKQSLVSSSDMDNENLRN